MKKKIILIIILALVFASALIYFMFPGPLYNFTVYIGREAAGLSKKSIQVDDHRIVYLEGGKGQDMLLIHGFGAEKDNWTIFARYLTSKYHVIIPDLPGFGESTKIKSARYDIASQVKRVESFIELLKLESIHIAGNSMGGCIAGVYSAKQPNRIKSLVLFDSFCVTPPEKSGFQLSLERGENPLLINSIEDFERVMKLIFYKPLFTPIPVKKYLALKATENRSFNQKVGEDMRAYPLNLEPLLGKIKTPVLIFWGDDDRVLDKSAVTVLESGIFRHKTIIMKQCGHVPMVERPEETAGYYLDFLKTI